MSDAVGAGAGHGDTAWTMTQSVTSKVSAILGVISSSPYRSLTEIARVTDLPLSTVHRLLHELVTSGLITRSEHAPAIEAAIRLDSDAPIFYAAPHLESVRLFRGEYPGEERTDAHSRKFFAFRNRALGVRSAARHRALHRVSGHLLQVRHCAVPPTVILSIFSVGIPTPTGTLWPSLPHTPTPSSSFRS